MKHTPACDIASQVYNTAHWSEGYFSINAEGQLMANPKADDKSIALKPLVDDLKAKGVRLPVLVRFTDILQNRVDSLTQAFAQAKKEKTYQGVYTAVYPIKVNQQASVIKKLLAHPSDKVGLEAGSKPELLAVLGLATRPIRIICNGYKDKEFLRLACIGQQMGHKVCIVIEKLSELATLIEVLKTSDVAPEIGIRIRLAAAAKGKWQNTGGEKGKFGLTANQVLEAIALLQKADRLSLLSLVHFHIGSQVANIRDIHRAMRECARHYAQLRQAGVPIKTVDVGGGLGVDYEGSASRSSCSMNYSMDEYARQVVYGLAEICQEQELPHPDIITESGRAMTAHHAVLITDVIEIERAPVNLDVKAPTEDASQVEHELWASYQKISPRHALEAYHDALHLYADAHEQYIHGILGISQWAHIEQIYFATLHKVRSQLSPLARSHREVLDELNEKLADKIFCNFSLFQSLPDVWGIEQLFPIMPLDKLDQPLSERGILQDITCDSDGQIRQYADGAGIESSLPLPAYPENERDMLLGMFMVGAYQEILGDMHNLFGDTDSVHVELGENGGYRITEQLEGESASDMLQHVHINPEAMLVSYQKQLTTQALPEEEAKALFAELKAGIEGYTYFEEA